MGLTERHWFENEDVPENYEWALEDAVYNLRTNKKNGDDKMTNEDAIKWLENLKQDICQLRHEDLWPHAQAIDEIIALLNEQRWTSTKERMPDKQGYYLVSGGGYVWTCKMLILGNIKGWSNSALRPCIEAWIPFPEPYKEGR